MSRRPNNITGPSSALTEFLREHGITARTTYHNPRARRDNNAEAGPSNAAGTLNEDEGGSNGVTPSSPGQTDANGGNTQNRSSRRKSGRKSGYASDDLDETDEEEKPAPKKQKLSKAAMAKMKAKQKAKYEKDSDYDPDEDAYNAPSKGAFGAKSGPMPPIGSFENCAKCEIQFTVTRYTMAAIPPPGFLCHDCAKAAGMDPFQKKKAAAPRKRKPQEEKRKIAPFEEIERVKSLANICIEVISKHIEDVEALGDVGTVNMMQIAKIVAKNRKLTPENAPLFYDAQNTTLTLYDATSLPPSALCTLASLNPNLKSLRLNLCGRMDDTVLAHYAQFLMHLTHLELFAPFLVRSAAWIDFLRVRGPALTGFLLTQSPRFDQGCVEALVDNCPNITELRLAEIGKMTDEFLPCVGSLQRLTYLDLSYPAESLNDEPVATLLRSVGQQLTHLNLSGNESLSDELFSNGLPYTGSLKSLHLANLPLLTDEGVAAFFAAFGSNPPLQCIDMSRNHLLSSAALKALLKHSGSALTDLNINSWKDTSNQALLQIGAKASGLVVVDLGWCRSVDDFVVKELLDHCRTIKQIKCYGCNRITENCPRKYKVDITGVELHTV